MNKKAIADQINRILSSSAFAKTRQLKGLLEFLFQNMDCQLALKPDRVCKHLWPDYSGVNPSADVGQPVSRLRNALQSYYSNEGEDDSILISLPDRSSRARGDGLKSQWITAEERRPVLEEAQDCAEFSEPIYPSETEPVPPGNVVVQGQVHRRNLGILATAGILVACLAAAGIWMAHARGEPNSGRLDGDTLTVLDAKGRELWKRTFTGGFSSEYYQKGLATRTWFVDLDGDGHTSILLLYQPAVNPTGRSTTLFCYSHRGEERWRWTPGRALPELGNEPAVFAITGLAILKASYGVTQRIVVSSDHLPYYPSQVALIDRNGRTISEYWHSGHLDFLALTDLDGDGRQEIVASGVANGYRQATLVVLDPDRVSGASVELARPELQIHGMGVAHERFRLLFPRSDLNLATSTYNAGKEITVSHGGIRVAVWECDLNPNCKVWYTFDQKMTLRSADPDDQMRDARAQFYRNSRNHPSFTDEDQKRFLKVRCIVGCPTDFVDVNTH